MRIRGLAVGTNRRAWYVALAALTVSQGVLTLSAPSSRSQASIYLMVIGGATVAMWLGVRTLRPGTLCRGH